MATITLSNGLLAEVDEEDLPLVLQYNWHGHKSRNKKYYYAVTNIRKADAALLGMKVQNTKGFTQLSLHRFLMGPGPRIDHKNGNALDCRRENMRWATSQQNSANRSKQEGAVKEFSSQYKGVGRTRGGRWRVATGKKNVGTFLTEEEAARAYDQRALELYGEFARLNFPVLQGAA